MPDNNPYLQMLQQMQQQQPPDYLQQMMQPQQQQPAAPPPPQTWQEKLTSIATAPGMQELMAGLLAKGFGGNRRDVSYASESVSRMREAERRANRDREALDIQRRQVDLMQQRNAMSAWNDFMTSKDRQIQRVMDVQNRQYTDQRNAMKDGREIAEDGMFGSIKKWAEALPYQLPKPALNYLLEKEKKAAEKFANTHTWIDAQGNMVEDDGSGGKPEGAVKRIPFSEYYRKQPGPTEMERKQKVFTEQLGPEAGKAYVESQHFQGLYPTELERTAAGELDPQGFKREKHEKSQTGRWVYGPDGKLIMVEGPPGMLDRTAQRQADDRMRNYKTTANNLLRIARLAVPSKTGLKGSIKGFFQDLSSFLYEGADVAGVFTELRNEYSRMLQSGRVGEETKELFSGFFDPDIVEAEQLKLIVAYSLAKSFDDQGGRLSDQDVKLAMSGLKAGISSEAFRASINGLLDNVLAQMKIDTGSLHSLGEMFVKEEEMREYVSETVRNLVDDKLMYKVNGQWVISSPLHKRILVDLAQYAGQRGWDIGNIGY